MPNQNAIATAKVARPSATATRGPRVQPASNRSRPRAAANGTKATPITFIVNRCRPGVSSPALDEAVPRGGQEQQPHHPEQEDESDELQILVSAREPVEGALEERPVLEPQEHLGPQHQDPRFVERVLHFAAQGHPDHCAGQARVRRLGACCIQRTFTS